MSEIDERRREPSQSPGQYRLSDVQMNCLIAAILTLASAGADTFLPESIVKRYADILEQLRYGARDYVNPSP